MHKASYHSITSLSITGSWSFFHLIVWNMYPSHHIIYVIICINTIFYQYMYFSVNSLNSLNIEAFIFKHAYIFHILYLHQCRNFNFLNTRNIKFTTFIIRYYSKFDITTDITFKPQWNNIRSHTFPDFRYRCSCV
jgi:hypothetical protein